MPHIRFRRPLSPGGMCGTCPTLVCRTRSPHLRRPLDPGGDALHPRAVWGLQPALDLGPGGVGVQYAQVKARPLSPCLLLVSRALIPAVVRPHSPKLLPFQQRGHHPSLSGSVHLTGSLPSQFRSSQRGPPSLPPLPPSLPPLSDTTLPLTCAAQQASRRPHRAGRARTLRTHSWPPSAPAAATSR